MTNKELKAHNENRTIAQVCMVTDDIYATMEKWVKYLKIGPWTVKEFNNDTVRDFAVDGKLVTEPFKFIIATTFVGETQFELIQPIEGPIIYTEFLQRRGPGLHHIKEKITNEQWDDVIEQYAQMDIPVTQTGWYGVDHHAYLDTEPKLDFILELGNCPYTPNPNGFLGTYPPEDE